MPRFGRPRPAQVLVAPPTPVAGAQQAVVDATVPELTAPTAQEPADAGAPGVVVSRELLSTWRVSRGPGGEPSDGPSSDVAMSADGRFIAFTSSAGNLVPGDGNDQDDVFLVDTATGQTTLVSASPDGRAGDGWSSGPAISADGRFVAFYSWAGDLTPGDLNAVPDVFIWDRAGSAIERITRSADGSQANDRSGDSRRGARPAIAADGGVVAFHSRASNLVDLDTNASQDVFVYDGRLRRTIRVSVSTAGEQANGDSRDPALSADGRTVAYASRAQGLDPAHIATRGVSQIYVHDLASGETKMVSIGADGLPGDGESSTPALSGDGRTLVFSSYATNLVPEDVNSSADIFVADVESGEVQRVSLSSAGAPGNGDSIAPAISLDGRTIAYASAATNLVNGDGNGLTDIFVFDRLTRHTGRASIGVTGPWTGLEANGESTGPPALVAGGRLIGYVSAATNLVAGESVSYPEVYAMERAELPSHVVRGRILDDKNRPVAGVTVSAGSHVAMTGVDGRFKVEHMTGGTYTFAPNREETSFVPARRTVTVVADVDDVDFRALTNGGARLAFLSLPLRDALSTSEVLLALRDSEEGGWVDAWFDHDAPNKSKNKLLRLWDGRSRDTGPFNAALGCFERRCYDGHDGTDFPYRDPAPATAAFEPLLVYPAAPGNVADVMNECVDGDRWCNRGYGNEVVLLHENGFFTRYAHLASLSRNEELTVGAPVAADDVLGVMGSTGNSYGAHLHFAVHQDDGNGRWDGEDEDVAVDPFGWSGQGPDPWAEHPDGALSRWMWNEHPKVERLVFGSHGATLRDRTGSLTLTLPPGALAGQLRLELDPGSPASPSQEDMRILGQSFWLRLLDWYPPTGPSAAAAELRDAVLAMPMEVSVQLEGLDTRHLDMERARVLRWDEGAGRWESLPTRIGPDSQSIHATSDRFGNFSVQAPLLCAEDTYEPDDGYHAATYVEPGQGPLVRLFDLADDEDWVRFEALRGQALNVRVDEIADGVTLLMEIYGLDGLTRLAAAEGTEGRPVKLAWSPPDDGTYFVRIAPMSGGRTGCGATYSVSLD